MIIHFLGEGREGVYPFQITDLKMQTDVAKLFLIFDKSIDNLRD